MAENDSPLTSQVVADSVDQLLVPVECILNCLVHSGKSGPKDQVALHYYTTILRLRIGARLTRYRNCKFHNFARIISRHADGISRYSVPPSAGGPLLPLLVHYYVSGVVL